MLSVSCFAAFSAVIGEAGSPFGPPVWQTSGGIVSLISPASIVNVTSSIFFISGNASVFDMDIRSPSSLTFDLGKYKLSAEDFVFPAMSKLGMNITGSRRQIVSDSDFQVRHNLSNSTAFFSVFNPGVGSLSKASLSIVNDITVGAALTKSSDEFSDPDVFEFNNNGGNFDIILGPLVPIPNQPVPAGEIRIGFYDFFTLTSDLGIEEFVGKKYYITINDTQGVTINADLIVNGTLFANNIYGSISFFDPTNGNTSLSVVGQYENVHGFMPEFSNEVTNTNGTYLTVLHDGIYRAEASYTFSSQSGLYSYALGVNDVEQNLTFQDESVQSTKTTSNSVQGVFSLSAGDNVSLMVADLNNPVKDVDVIRANIFINRLGDQ